MGLDDKDYFDEVFGRDKNGKPQRFLDEDDGKWKCVSCGREDRYCKCAEEVKANG